MICRSQIVGVHGFLPDYILTNTELEKLVDTNKDWIVSMTGIKQRRILKQPGLSTVFMATQAAKKLLHKCNVDPKDIELVLCATITSDYIMPASANIISFNVGAINAFSYDISAACSGFLYALVTASSFIETGRYKNAIVIGADKMSSIIDYTNRSTSIIFGDGAGAVLLQKSEDNAGIIDSLLKSDGSGYCQLIVKAGGSLYPSTVETIANKEHFLSQNGKIVFKSAVERLSESISNIMNRNRLSPDDISWVVPHQANIRIIKAVAERCELSMEKILLNIENVGNTTAASIPLCLWQSVDKIKRGDRIIMASFGAGYTWGAVYMIW